MRTIIMLLTCALLTSKLAAQQLPTDRDLRAAFCLSWYNEGSSLLDEAERSAANTAIEEDVKKSSAETRMRHERLRNYLLPRIPNLEPMGLIAASVSGKNAFSRQMNGINNCFTQCEKSAMRLPCIKSCTTNITEETNQCRDLSWLPY